MNPATPVSPHPTGSALAHHWALDPAKIYLNHGSFGACPRAVLAAQDALRARMEADAVAFFVEDFESLMDSSRAALANMLSCAPGCIAPITNATWAVATVADNLLWSGFLRAGDEILVPSHEYPACKNIMAQLASRTGARVVTVELPFPITGPDEVFDRVLAAATDRTRLALLSHVTSPTGLVLPIERLVPALEGRGIRTLVDGAHGIGMLPLNLGALRPSYYTSNCHKWLCAPKGAGFLFVREDLQTGFRPLALSNNANLPKPGRAQFLTEFEFCGTTDATAFLVLPEAIRFVSSLVPGGWPEVMRHNRALCLQGRAIVCEALNVAPPAPESMIASIATIILPPHHPHDEPRRKALSQRKSKYHDALQDALLRTHRIQVPIWGLADKPDRFVRVSAQLYNTPEQYRELARALRTELDAEARLPL
ncbi:MAG: aminotransferase class V-fold PLP-dependent enzyme [Planctomycetota bacterium]|nr:aminotransferase class V-fold PLP-dependent enzyme [Planctomycetota bacterium]